MNYYLFCVGMYKAKLTLNVNKIIKRVKNIQSKDKGRNISNPKGTGWQSNELNLKDFIDLQEHIKPHVIKYMNTISLQGTARMEAAWANINSYKDYNEIHAHGGSQISAVYYLNKPKNSGNLFFENPFKMGMDSCWNGRKKKHNEYTSSRMTVPVETNDLILFPGWLAHGVEPNLNKKEDRISIAANIFI
tara:strand:+ start:2374 stop:2943 length:570 start_codon:yes stop_codon:yes gene_type:complete